MAGASATLHEAKLSPETIDRHRAIVSLMEELEAADWYDQRVEATSDESLRAILAHNRDEEKEHAAMLLEWLRRRDARLDGHLRTYLFTEAPTPRSSPWPRVAARRPMRRAADRARGRAGDERSAAGPGAHPRQVMEAISDETAGLPANGARW